MKIIAIADMHLTEHRPMCRAENEDWISVIDEKFNQIRDMAEGFCADRIVIAGDVFDVPARNTNWFICKCIKWFDILKSVCPVNAIPGNHDLIMGDQDSIYSTSFGVLEQSGCFTTPDDFGIIPYGETQILGERKVVIAHQGLWLKEKPFEGASDSGSVHTWVKDHIPEECRLLITGHFHVPFCCKSGNTAVINCGSVFRLRADQIDYQPGMWLIDYDEKSNSVKVKRIPFILTNQIRRDYIEEKTEEKKKIETLVGSVCGDFELSINFKENFYNLTNTVDDREKIVKEFERCNQ